MATARGMHSTLGPAEQRKLATLARLQFCNQVRLCAGPIDEESVLFYGRLCETIGHQLMKPRLQYLSDDANRGRFYVVCKHAHGTGSRNKGFFRYVSTRLQVKVRSGLEDWRIARELQDEGLRLIDIPAPPSSSAANRAPGLRSYSIPRAKDSRPPALRSAGAPTAPPTAAGRPRSPSIEFIEPPAYRSSPNRRLRVLFYFANDLPPLSLSLPLRYIDAHVFMRDFANIWEKEEVKMQDPVKVLTHADEDMLIWQPATLRRLVLPPRTHRIIVARGHVSGFHRSLDARHHWSCNIVSLPDVKPSLWPAIPADWVF